MHKVCVCSDQRDLRTEEIRFVHEWQSVLSILNVVCIRIAQTYSYTTILYHLQLILAVSTSTVSTHTLS